MSKSRPAAFINALAEEGTKDEAIHCLQKIWNDKCELRLEVERLQREVAATAEDMRERAARIADSFHGLSGDHTDTIAAAIRALPLEEKDD